MSLENTALCFLRRVLALNAASKLRLFANVRIQN